MQPATVLPQQATAERGLSRTEGRHRAEVAACDTKSRRPRRRTKGAPGVRALGGEHLSPRNIGTLVFSADFDGVETEKARKRALSSYLEPLNPYAVTKPCVCPPHTQGKRRRAASTDIPQGQRAPNLTPARSLRFLPAALGCFWYSRARTRKSAETRPTSRGGANGPESRRKRATAAKPRFQP
jgi:hypothetical protein